MTIFPPILAEQAPRAPRPQPGHGTRLTASNYGYSLSARSDGGAFAHPFKPSLTASGIRLAKGLVDEFEPTIKGVPISGDAENPQPVLELDPDVASEAGESWVCVEVEAGTRINDAGEEELRERLSDESRAEIVHVDTPRSLDQAIGRQALVLIVWQRERVFRALTITHFNLRYARIGAVRHLFF